MSIAPHHHPSFAVRDLCVDAEVRRRGGRLAIVCVPGPVLRVFELTGIAASLPLHVDA
jgi:anti-anti-sigma regulatory factor